MPKLTNEQRIRAEDLALFGHVHSILAAGSGSWLDGLDEWEKERIGSQIRRLYHFADTMYKSGIKAAEDAREEAND
jgi:hypothetical protein